MWGCRIGAGSSNVCRREWMNGVMHWHGEGFGHESRVVRWPFTSLHLVTGGYLILRELVLARSHASLPQLPLAARPEGRGAKVRHTPVRPGAGPGPGGLGEGLAAQRPGHPVAKSRRETARRCWKPVCGGRGTATNGSSQR